VNDWQQPQERLDQAESLATATPLNKVNLSMETILLGVAGALILVAVVVFIVQYSRAVSHVHVTPEVPAAS
jgi:hypothetical protein